MDVSLSPGKARPLTRVNEPFDLVAEVRTMRTPASAAVI
jgi:hypothetical protein